jgi:hypothetical protein
MIILLEAQTYYKLRYTWEKIENAIDAVKAVR